MGGARVKESIRVHVFGASGSGTSTLGRALASALGVAFLDSDDFFWEPTDPPFNVKTEVVARQAAIAAATRAAGSWVLAGSMMEWGDFLAPEIDLAVYLYLPPDIRLSRLAARERARYGDRIDEGGDVRSRHLEFMDWAARYETAGMELRSKVSHAAWIERLACPVLRIEGDVAVEEGVERVAAELYQLGILEEGGAGQRG
jgi:adenylate kinase family enzyme